MSEKAPRWNYVNTLITWAIASVVFFWAERKYATTNQAILLVVACVVVTSLVNLAINAIRTRNRPQ